MINQKALSISSQTKQKVEAAKIFIQQRYSRLIQQEKQKRDYWQQLNQKMRSMNMPEEQRQVIKKNILHKEAQRLREQRKKISILDFDPVKIIGKGAFGEVRLCKWAKNGQPVAVKKLKKSQMIYKNKVIQVREERNVLANCQKNPWIVGLKCSFQDYDNLYLVMDYVPGGDLMNLLIKKDIFTHEEAKFYIAQMILAIDSVHQLKYIHRDIKPDNILIDQKGHITLSDFGLCKHTEMRPKKLLQNLRKNTTSKQKVFSTIKNDPHELRHRRRKLAFSAVGTPDYVAPEVQGKSGYTETVDWWSLGVIFYEMLVGYPPFASEDSSITWQKIQNWRKYLVIPKDANVSPQAVDLIRKLVNDADQRLGINGVQQIMAHPFFAGVNWKKIRQSKPPNIPILKNPFDTSNFDPFDEEQPWISQDSKIKFKNKKFTQFIGYTFKPEEEGDSYLLKALVDLDNFRQPEQLHRNPIESLYIDSKLNDISTSHVFKKQNKKEFYGTTTMMSPKHTNKNVHSKMPSPPASKKNTDKKAQSPSMRDEKKPFMALTSSNFGVGNISTATTTQHNGSVPKVKIVYKKPLQFRK